MGLKQKSHALLIQRGCIWKVIATATAQRLQMTLRRSGALGVHISKGNTEQDVFLLHSRTRKHRKTCGDPASLLKSLLWPQERKAVKINVMKSIPQSRNIYSHDIPSDLAHDLFTAIRWFKLVSSLQKKRTRKKAEEERTVVLRTFWWRQLLQHREPRETTTKTQK